jgi:type IV pilus assembly protein PilA
MKGRFSRAGDERGFTLIELLVVILIIGILAGIAIPSFLSQRGKAYDASAKEMARTASEAAETFSTDHNGSYAGIEPSVLHEYENAIQTAEGSGNAWVSSAKATESGAGYSITATAVHTKDKYTIERVATGAIKRSCESPENGCAGAKTSSW